MSFIAAGVMAGLSVVGGLAGNSAISAQASRQYEANKLFIERDRQYMENQLGLLGVDVNSELGAKLSELRMQANRVFSETVATQAETNVYGNTARRLQLAVEMQEEMAADNLAQAADSKMLDVQKQLSQAKYDIDNKHRQNKQAYNQLMGTQQTAFGLIGGGIAAGFSGYTAEQTVRSGIAANKKLKGQISAITLPNGTSSYYPFTSS
jgi:hypothetical protein